MNDRSQLVTITLLAVVLVAGAVGLFLVDAGSSQPDPVRFDDTVTMGLTLEDERALPDDVDLPRVQVFYSQYEYVVGYYGIEAFTATRAQDGHEQLFGYPLALYVTDYSGADLELDDDGYPRTDGFGGWVDATDAHFVVDSEARTPAGEAALSFANREDAAAFAAEYGGTVVDWDAVLERPVTRDDAETARDRVDDQHAEADELVESVAPLRDRPVSVTVDEGGTIQEAVDAAPDETTVFVPNGTYEERIVIDRPITLAGPGADGGNATIDGGGNGSVITVEHDDVAVVGLEVTGTGDTLTDRDAAIDEDEWDANVEQGYGHGDAAVRVINSSGVLVEDVTIETRANGVLVRDSPENVVRNVTVYGSEEWIEGFMGVMTMRSPGVIEESTFYGGRDNVYTHRSDGVVIRNNGMYGGRFGVHIMHASDTLLADNVVREQELAGLMVMTAPQRTAIVDNDVRHTPGGIRTSGSDSYVARNVLAHNELGLTTNAETSIYEDNVIVDNEVGVRAAALVPSNRVVGNAFIGNDVHAETAIGSLRFWSHDDRGNYWEGAVGSSDDGVTLERSYTPTDPIDRSLHRVDGTPTLTRAPVRDAIAGLQGTVPGMRGGSIVDQHPLCEPPQPELLEAAGIDPDRDTCEAQT
ncbi:NosD domain-containing protein [Natrialbaceae archaeon A-chndr2]